MTATTTATRKPRATTRKPAAPVDAAAKAEASVLDGVRTATKPATRKATPEPSPARPAAKAAPEITRKMQIARDMADAIARTAAPLSADEKQAVANMIHHFPTGKDASGRRWWPKNFPTPARSEWK